MSGLLDCCDGRCSVVARARQCCGEHRLFDDGHAGGHVLIVRRRALTVGPRVHVGVGRVTLFRYGRGYGWVLGGAGPVLGELRMVGLCGVARAHRGGHHGGVDRYGARADALDDLGQVGGDDDGVSSASASGAGDREVRVVDKGAGEHADHERVVGGRVARHSPRGPPRLTHRHVVGGGGSVIEIGDGVGCQCKRGRAVGHRGGDGRVGRAPRAQYGPVGRSAVVPALQERAARVGGGDATCLQRGVVRSGRHPRDHGVGRGVGRGKPELGVDDAAVPDRPVHRVRGGEHGDPADGVRAGNVHVVPGGVARPAVREVGH